MHQQAIFVRQEGNKGFRERGSRARKDPLTSDDSPSEEAFKHERVRTDRRRDRKEIDA
jgi:hypothetical protein